MNEIEKFDEEKRKNIEKLSSRKQLGIDFIRNTLDTRYKYNFSWLGRPIIQFPQDMIAIQELIWNIKPDLIIETGIAHGGSLILSASMLAQLDLIEAIESDQKIDPKKSKRKVLGIDIEIRNHNKVEILLLLLHKKEDF